jgi:hypothetical protein
MRGVHDQHHDLGEGDGADGVLGGELFQLLLNLRLLAQAGSVDQAHLLVAPDPVDRDGVARDARFRTGQQTLLADQAVDQGGLAGVRTADDGQADRLVVVVLVFGILVLGEGRQHGGVELGHAFAVLARNRNRFAQAQLVGFADARLAGFALGLVGGDDHRLAATAQQGGEHFIQRGDAFAGVVDEQRDVRFLDGQLGLMTHARLQAFVRDVLEAGGVDQFQVQVAEAARGITAVTRNTRLVVDDSQLLAGQTIEQRGLAHIGAADDGEFQRHRRPVVDFCLHRKRRPQKRRPGSAFANPGPKAFDCLLGPRTGPKSSGWRPVRRRP